jgi:ATP-dependent DNA ligase
MDGDAHQIIAPAPYWQPRRPPARHLVQRHMEGDDETVFRHACKLGLEGIVSKRKDSAYRSGRSPDWLKMKNSDAPAVKREEEEEWGKKKWR